MYHLDIEAQSHTYQVHVGRKNRFSVNKWLTKDYSSILIITDENVAPLYLSDVKRDLEMYTVYQTIVPASETSKSIHWFYELHTKAIQFGLDRNSLIIALGGGVVGDLAGFVASTYMRGIDYIQIPTTILAHDSSVGGKVAINHELGKNMIGQFYPPVCVVYDIDVLKTLSKREFRSGYAEIMKEALLADEMLLHKLLQINLDSISNDDLVEHIRKGIQIKADIVQQDETEKNTRKYLNLGHTLAHAIEANIGYGQLTHGEAVAIGLLFAIRVSEHTFSIQLPYQELKEWMQVNGYPLCISNMNIDELLKSMQTDKKTVKQHIQMVLLKDVAKPVVKEFSNEELRSHLARFLYS
ncbi:3-dehydroquinate synthase [Oceanobacillus halotolerans]|uniref:3-dehydroquinate synthase n=1 Tax=Oceanobacillus halotolerans TaxID=2663380 RepID=UPI0013DCE16B|nr:3-dehydroquinate synthase [Oceanobacillus halotolerans]